MANTFKTARGKVIDMDKIKLANENVIAIGNMKVNARGDKIGANGAVEAGRNAIMDQVYTVPGGGYSPNDPEQEAQRAAMMDAARAKELENIVKTAIQEPEKTAESSESTTRSARGSLASSIKK